MRILNGKRHNNNPGIGGAYAYQVESRIIIFRPDNEMPGVGTLRSNMEKGFIHRYLLTPHAPATFRDDRR